MTQRKFWVELSALHGVWWALPLILPSLSCSKHSAASSRFAMHSSYEEVVSGAESSFSFLKPYLHDSIITWSIQTLSVNQFKQWHIPSPFSSLRKEIQLKVTFVKCKSCIVQNELLLKPQKVKNFKNQHHALKFAVKENELHQKIWVWDFHKILFSVIIKPLLFTTLKLFKIQKNFCNDGKKVKKVEPSKLKSGICLPR